MRIEAAAAGVKTMWRLLRNIVPVYLCGMFLDYSSCTVLFFPARFLSSHLDDHLKLLMCIVESNY